MSEDTPNMQRRGFLAGGAVCALLPLKPNAANAAPAQGSYPSVLIGNVNTLKVDVPVSITYPDVSSPGLLIKLGKVVDGGVGPDQDIVAFSAMCPHKGIGLIYAPSDKSLNCPEHRSRFDCEKGGMEIWGHATENLAQFKLRVDARGNIFADGVDELIYGRISNILM
jgi:arsenite oxidase small subunit